MSLQFTTFEKCHSNSLILKPATRIHWSERLAAKPTAGWSDMEKVNHVLLKKSGVLQENEDPSAADLEKYQGMYRGMYSKPLPPNFMEAVSTLVEVGLGVKNKTAGGVAVPTA